MSVAIPNGPTSTKRSLSRVALLLLSVLVSTLANPNALATTEKRDVVFELDPGRVYPDYEVEMLKVVTVDGFIGNSGHRLHLPGELSISYDPNDIRPNGLAPLTFSFDPIDGPTLEYDLERGVSFGIDVKIWDWGFKYGNDFEEDFVPPVGSAQSHSGYDQTLEIWGKSVRCAGGISFGVFTRETFEGDVVRVPFRIVQPAGGVGVTFAETGTDYIELQFTSPGDTDTATLDISLLYLSPNITITAEDPRFELIHDEAWFEPGVEAWIVDPDLPWDPCNQKTATKTIEWINWPTSGVARSILLDPTESDGLSFRFKNKVWPFSTPMVQDLGIESYRSAAGLEPELGGVDPIVTVIRNIHGDVCSGYGQIDLAYFVVDGALELPIGSRTLTPGNPILDDFNTGVTDQMMVVFDYDDGSPNYILNGEHDWETTDPFYRVEMTAQPDPPCTDWELGDEPPLVFDNDVDRVPYALPLPDFALDSLIVGSPPYVMYGDTLDFEIRVTNKGVLWPPPSIPGPPPIRVDCRVGYERWTPIPGNFTEIVFEYIGQQLLGPMGRGDYGTYLFQYIVPLEPDLQHAAPLDLIRFTFEAQDGTLPLGPLNWDRNYENNTLSANIFITDYPDLSLPSTQAYANGDSIVTNMPYYCAEPVPCSRPIFLYVRDGKLDYTIPHTPPANLRVWLGAGPYQSSPEDPGWVWFPCSFERDFADDKGRSFKVFKGNLCWVNLPIAGKRSYAFRSSLDFTDDHPTYAYVDRDGTSTVRGAENVYYLDQAGTVDWPCHCQLNGPSVVGVGIPVNFDAGASEGQDGRPIIAYDWDFGDGHFGDGYAVGHVYQEVGGYEVELCITDDLLNEQCCTQSLNVTTGTGVAPPLRPARLTLHPAEPNPFNPSTTIRVDLPQDGEPLLAVYDVRGRHVVTLLDEWMPAGSHPVVWNGQTASGRQAQSGVYLLRLSVGEERRTGRLVLLK